VQRNVASVISTLDAHKFQNTTGSPPLTGDEHLSFVTAGESRNTRVFQFN